MATIYATPKELGPAPEFSPSEGFSTYEGKIAAFVKSVGDWAKANGSSELAGEEIRFGVGDGYACYVVLSLKPVKLIWLPIGDRWQFQYANRLTAADVREEVRNRKAIAKLFSRKGS